MSNIVERYLIEEKKNSYLLKLDVINEALNEEMQKHHSQRNKLLLNILSEEKSVYKFALSELQSLLAVKSSMLEENENKQDL